MSFMYYGSAIIACLAVFSFLFFCKDKSIFGSKLTNKQFVTLIYGVLFFVRFMGGTPRIEATVGLNQFSPFGVHGIPETFISVVLLWLIYTVQLAEVTFPFFDKHVPLVAPIVKSGGALV